MTVVIISKGHAVSNFTIEKRLERKWEFILAGYNEMHALRMIFQCTLTAQSATMKIE
jgi:predicted DNA-binding protein (UPF0251 family)